MAREKLSIAQDHRSYFFPVLHLKAMLKYRALHICLMQLSAFIWFHQRPRKLKENLQIGDKSDHSKDLITGALEWRLLRIMGQEGNVQMTTALNYSSCFQISFSHSKQQSHLYSQTKGNSFGRESAELTWNPVKKISPLHLITCKSKHI